MSSCDIVGEPMQDFNRDLSLAFDDAMAQHPRDSSAYKMARLLQNKFRAGWNQLVESLKNQATQPVVPMSLNEKCSLSRAFKMLPEDKLSSAVDIIRRRVVVDTTSDDDIVIDIDALDDEVLWELKAFIDGTQLRTQQAVAHIKEITTAPASPAPDSRATTPANLDSDIESAPCTPVEFSKSSDFSGSDNKSPSKISPSPMPSPSPSSTPVRVPTPEARACAEVPFVVTQFTATLPPTSVPMPMPSHSPCPPISFHQDAPALFKAAAVPAPVTSAAMVAPVKSAPAVAPVNSAVMSTDAATRVLKINAVRAACGLGALEMSYPTTCPVGSGHEAQSRLMPKQNTSQQMAKACVSAVTLAAISNPITSIDASKRQNSTYQGAPGMFTSANMGSSSVGQMLGTPHGTIMWHTTGPQSHTQKSHAQSSHHSMRTLEQQASLDYAQRPPLESARQAFTTNVPLPAACLQNRAPWGMGHPVTYLPASLSSPSSTSYLIGNSQSASASFATPRILGYSIKGDPAANPSSSSVTSVVNLDGKTNGGLVGNKREREESFHVAPLKAVKREITQPTQCNSPSTEAAEDLLEFDFLSDIMVPV
jgi:hypothetical protein